MINMPTEIHVRRASPQEGANVLDLLLCAKHLFVAASSAGARQTSPAARRCAAASSRARVLTPLKQKRGRARDRRTGQKHFPPSPRVTRQSSKPSPSGSGHMPLSPRHPPTKLEGIALTTGACTHKIAIGDSGLMKVRFAPLCGLKSDISRGQRSARNGLMHRSNWLRYSTTSSARAEQRARSVRPRVSK